MFTDNKWAGISDKDKWMYIGNGRGLNVIKNIYGFMTGNVSKILTNHQKSTVIKRT